MPLETLERLPRSRRGARRHRARGRRGGRASCSPSSQRPASTTTTSSRRSSARACRSSPTAFDELIDGHRGQARRAGGEVTHRAARARRADLVARPDRLDGKRRGALARLARRAVADARATPSGCSGASAPTTHGDATRSSCSGWAAPRSRRRCSGAPFGGHRPSTCSTRPTRRRSAPSRRSSTWSGRSSCRLEVGLDARDPLAHGLLLEARAARRPVGRDHRSGLDARPARRTSAGSRRSCRASRRSAAATRPSRRSGSCRRR